MAALTWRCTTATDVGKRRKINEDAVLERNEEGLWLVADGMGGHAAGDIASQAVVHACRQLSLQGSLIERLDKLEDTLIDVNHQLLAYAQEHLQGRTMGSTALALMAWERWALCVWVGDSRLYRWRHGEFVQVSRDHSKWQELRDGGADEEALSREPQLKNVITRAVGGQLQLFAEVQLLHLESGDRFLLCTDGLYNELENNDIASLLSQGEIHDVGQRLMGQALRQGARDNVSLIVVEVL